MSNLFKRSAFLPVMIGLGLSLTAASAFSQESEPAAAPVAPVGPVICPGYVRAKTKLPGQSVGKKVADAFEAYNEDRVSDAVEILEGLDPKDKYDAAYVKRFLGNILAGQDGEGEKALGYLIDAVEPKILNDTDHASLLKLIGDLSIQESKYKLAIEYYDKWSDFTCKEDADVYMRTANAYYQLKEYPEIVEPADKAIALYKKPNKNPYILKLQSFYERKMFPEAIVVAKQLVVNFPEEPRWWTQLGTFYLSTEDYEHALSIFEMADIQGFLNKKSEIQTLSQLYGAVGIPHKAAQVLKEHMGGLIEKDKDSLSRLANSYQQAREYKTAANYYGEAARLSSDPEMYQKQGTLLLVIEDYKGAIAALKAALANDSDDKGQINYALMEAYFYVGDYKQAFAYVQEAKKDKDVRRNANAWVPYIETKAKNKGIKL